jgi:tripartite-type tricarboxylate transporter receptor subunit TctC
MGALRKAVVASIAVGAAAMLVPAGAQDYPNRPVRILAGAPGTLTESAARQVGQRLSERWGKPVWWRTALPTRSPPGPPPKRPLTVTPW